MNKGLEEYRKKRDFSKTAEPYIHEGEGGERPGFVVQKHDASHLHYDVRLEVDGVLKSWAVPKGPSTDPHEKRLAIPTEDHPLAYIDFEGVIPEGEYGAGTVMVWDIGTYRNLRQERGGEPVSMARSIDEGKVEVWLDGKKLKGGFALIRTGKSGEKRWLFFKMDDTEADARRNPTVTEPDSALSGRSMEEIREDESPEK